MGNYSGLTMTELSSLAETDQGAREYFADNARRFIAELEEMKTEYDLTAVDCESQFDEGIEDLRYELRERFCENLAREKARPGVDPGTRAMLADLQSCFECDDDGEAAMPDDIDEWCGKKTYKDDKHTRWCVLLKGHDGDCKPGFSLVDPVTGKP